ncbi:MAG: sulfite exporter TauE/SafE family protein [Clostridia bacterium]|nr:sulfite exporter TauE/SafE family protein [Clostridia bacterium]
MSFFILMLLGFLGGIPAGMGMGGGTIAIPLLRLVGGIEQKIAQSANLFSFLWMSLPALAAHQKNGLLNGKGVLACALPAAIVSLPGVFLATYLPSRVLGKAFGLFLIGLAFYTVVNKLQTKKA